MYTQCPECHTVFALTQAQLAAHGGTVRCGQCRHVFRADHFMFDTLPHEFTAASASSAAATPTAAPANEDTHIPTITDFSWTQARTARPKHTALWALGSIFLFIALGAQYVYFNRLRWPDNVIVKQAITYSCEIFACALPALQDLAALELLEVEIAPHPQFEAALLVNALLLNDARFPQRYPTLEMSFTDSQGITIARRAFAPSAYLPQGTRADAAIAPGGRVAVAVAVTQPSVDAVGYEIQLVSPR